MSNLHPHKKVNTLQGCTDTSCWLFFLLQLYGRCNSHRHHPAARRELSPFWKWSAHIQYLQNTSTSKRSYKGVDKMMENYMLLTLSVAASGGFFYFMGENTVVWCVRPHSYFQWNKFNPACKFSVWRARIGSKLSHTHPQCIWLINV